MAGFSNETMYANNVNFSGAKSPAVTLDGQLMIGSNVAPNIRIGTLTAGAGISIANGSGSITISTTGYVSTWTDVSGAFSPLKNNGYFITGTATGTLPASPSQGDTIQFFVDTTQFLTIQASGSQIIRLGSLVSSAGGTAVNTLQGDSITLVYRSSNTSWEATSFIGTWVIS